MRASRPDLTLPHHPAVVDQFNKRANDAQVRLADQITRFAGSMGFVYLHIVVFAFWMLVVERSPWPKLTLIVSLEAIFLSTFVMIGQNRQSAFQQAKADHDFLAQELELKTNTDLTRAVHQLTKEIHTSVAHREKLAKTDEGLASDRRRRGASRNAREFLNQTQRRCTEVLCSRPYRRTGPTL